MGQSSPTSAAQMYAYSNYPFQRQPQPPMLQHMSRSSPPQSTWAVPQSQNSYYAGSRGPMAPSRDEHAQFFQRSNTSTTVAPPFTNVALSNGMTTSAEYFPNVIDTSMLYSVFHTSHANMKRFLGRKSLRRTRVVSVFGLREYRLQPWSDGSG